MSKRLQSSSEENWEKLEFQTESSSDLLRETAQNKKKSIWFYFS